MVESVNQNGPKETEAPSEAALQPKEKSRRKLGFFFLAAGALFVGVATLGVYTRNTWTANLQQRTNQAAQFVVPVTHPEMTVGIISLHVPCQNMPTSKEPTVAHTRGYL